MFARRFFPGRFFAPRYFPQSQGDTPEAPGNLPQTFISISIKIGI